MTKEQIEEFEESAKPLVKFLSNFHPHITVIVDSIGAELLEGSCRVKIEEFIKD